MHIQFLDYLADPLTKRPLSLTIAAGKGDFVESGFLQSDTGNYPIVRGIPRFVDFEKEDYAASFGYQWRKWPRVQFESENKGKPMEGHTRMMWESITGVTTIPKNQVVLDIGCGPGRFVDVARQKGAKVIGIDYSLAVEAAAKNFQNDPDVCICQADALNLPIRQSSIDAAFSVGVLHHTPNPERGVLEAVKVLKESGWLAVCVYGKSSYYDFSAVNLWRGIFKSLWPYFGHYPALIYTYCIVYGFYPFRALPPLNKAVRIMFPYVNLPDINWSLLDTFDSLTPTYQSTHEGHEVFGWLKKAGLREIEPTKWGPTSWRGVKIP